MKSHVLPSLPESALGSNQVFALREFGSSAMVRFRHDTLPYPVMAWKDRDNATAMGLALARSKAWMTYVVEIDPTTIPVPVFVIDNER